MSNSSRVRHNRQLKSDFRSFQSKNMPVDKIYKFLNIFHYLGVTVVKLETPRNCGNRVGVRNEIKYCIVHFILFVLWIIAQVNFQKNDIILLKTTRAISLFLMDIIVLYCSSMMALINFLKRKNIQKMTIHILSEKLFTRTKIFG